MGKKAKEFKGMNVEQLNAKLDELRMELIKHNAQIATGTIPKSPGLIRQTKKNIARIITIINMKKQGGVDKKV